MDMMKINENNIRKILADHKNEIDEITKKFKDSKDKEIEEIKNKINDDNKKEIEQITKKLIEERTIKQSQDNQNKEKEEEKEIEKEKKKKKEDNSYDQSIEVDADTFTEQEWSNMVRQANAHKFDKFETHMETEHVETQIHSCKGCNFTTIWKTKLNEHIKSNKCNGFKKRRK